nr:hypothetical chloroplast RF19 [Gibasis geniculata]
MILKSFLLGNLLSLCMKIINSVVVVGLYYGFLTTFSIGPSYLFLLRARVIEEGTEKGIAARTGKGIAARTGFIAGQLMMFISIYYAPLHLALDRPHTITVLVLPYLLFHFFWNDHKNFLDYGSTTRNSMRNLSIQCVFLNNLIFQLFNHFILPSSTLARLVNIYMFRCNNKMLFLTSGFVGWLIGHIFFMKWVRLVLFWIRQNYSIRSTKYELQNSMARIFSILLFITCVYYLGRMPSPIITKKLKDTSEAEEWIESEEEQEDPYEINETEEIRVNGKEKTKHEFHFHFKDTCYKDSPVYEDSYLDRYQDNWEFGRLKEERNEEERNEEERNEEERNEEERNEEERNEEERNEEERNEEERNEKTFFSLEKPLLTFLFDYKRWNRPFRYIKNNQFENTVRNEMSQFFFYICPSDGKRKMSFTYLPSLSTFSQMIERRMSLYTTEKCSHENLYNYWVSANEQKKYNLNNELINRIKILEKKNESPSLDILEKRNRLCNDENEEKYLPKEYDPIFLGPSRKKKKLDSKKKLITSIEDSIEMIWINKIYGLLFNSQQFEHKKNMLDNKSSWNFFVNSSTDELSFGLSTNLNLKKGYLLGEEKRIDSESKAKFLKCVFDIITNNTNDPNDPKDQKNSTVIEIQEITKRVPRWLYKLTDELEEEGEEGDADCDIRSRKGKQVVIYTDNEESEQSEEITLIRYLEESDFRRNIIKGSMRAQRRKTVIWEIFQEDVHSPLFFYFDIYEMLNIVFQKFVGRNPKLKISDFERLKKYEEEKRKKENDQITRGEIWDNFLFGPAIRSFMLITQSYIRKYIVLPSLIIGKNVGRILLFQSPEWDEDWKEWNKEIHVKCTFNGFQLSETEFPKNWLTEGIQIKILYPFCLKPWQESKGGSPRGKRFSFLTVLGMETKLPFGSYIKRPSFFEPIYRTLKNKIIYESNENKKDYKKYNEIPLESSIQIESVNWINYPFIEIEKKDLVDKTIALRNQIEEIAIEKKKGVLTCNDKRRESHRNIWRIFKRKSTRLIRKSYYFMKSFIEKIYVDTLLYIINIAKINTQLSKKKKFTKTKLIDNWKINQERGDETDQNTMNFISTIKKHSSITNINKNSNTNIYYDLSSLSQAYVFYKLSQIKLLKKNRLRSIFQYCETRPFLRNKIKYYCMIQAIFYFKSRHNKITNSGMNEWKNWLKGHYQYNLSQTKWSRLVPPKWRNKINRRYTTQNKNSIKLYSYNNSKDKFDHYPKEHYFTYTANLLTNKKDNLKKHYGYALLLHKYINYGDINHADIYEQRLQAKKDQEISYNFNTGKPESFYVLVKMAISNYLEDRYILHTHKNMDRKFFDCKILYFILRENKNIESWTNIGTKLDKNTKTEKKLEKKWKNKDLFFLRIHQENNPSNKKKKFFNWMGMNQKEDSPNISNLEPWLFPEFWLLFVAYDAYKIQQWIIPIKLLLFDIDIYLHENNIIISQNQNINVNENKNFKISSNIKKSIKFFEFQNFNQEKKEQVAKAQENPGSDPRKQEQKNNIEESFEESNSKKKTQSNKNEKAELSFLLNKNFLFQLKWNDCLSYKIFKNIKIYGLLLSVTNHLQQIGIPSIIISSIKEIVISSIERRDMHLSVMRIQKDLTLIEFIKSRIFFIEPIRVSIKKDGKFIIYQTITIGISLVDKKGHGKEIKYVDKQSFEKSNGRHRNMPVNGYQNHYNFLVPETILSPRRRRELRTLICFNSCNWNAVHKNPLFWKVCNKNNIRNSQKFLNEDKHFNTDQKKFIKCKLFLWPNYRLEDLACISRYWFDTHNGSRFSMLRIRMYPRLRIN